VGTRNFERVAAPHPTQAIALTSHKVRFPSKNLSLVRSVSTQLSRFFEKIVKTEGGHRALGSPRAWSVFALVQGHSLLSLKRCRKLVNIAIDKFLNSRTCEQGMQHLFVDVRGSHSYSMIKQAQVFDVPCVGDDPPVLVLDLVSPGLEHFVDDELPLPRW
jgi:hypothetical protein